MKIEMIITDDIIIFSVDASYRDFSIWEMRSRGRTIGKTIYDRRQHLLNISISDIITRLQSRHITIRYMTAHMLMNSINDPSNSIHAAIFKRVDCKDGITRDCYKECPGVFVDEGGFVKQSR